MIEAKVETARVLRDPVLLLAFGFGSGLARRAPGTVGTLAAVPLYLLLELLGTSLYLVAVFIVIVAGVWICGRAAEKLGVHDHPGIVWDEFAGLFVALIPAGGHWMAVATGVILFRLFDIWKPWPIGVIDRRVGGGAGIMLDDLLAALPAAAGVALVAHLGG